MSKERARRSGRQAEVSTATKVAKITIRLDEVVAKRLGVEAVMTGRSQSEIANRVLGQYLEGWRLPSKIGATITPADPAVNAA